MSSCRRQAQAAQRQVNAAQILIQALQRLILAGSEWVRLIAGLKTRFCISIRGFVGPSVNPSMELSMGPSIGL